MADTSHLAWRALLAFLALPGIVAFAAPVAGVLLTTAHPQFAATGLLLLVPGLALLLRCVVEFVRRGRGTLASWDPPVRLVDSGPYRFSRNPMYVAVLAIVSGWALGFHSPGLAAYAAALAVGFHIRVVTFEEPWLARTFPDQWRTFRERTPRWLGWPARS